MRKKHASRCGLTISLVLAASTGCGIYFESKDPDRGENPTEPDGGIIALPDARQPAQDASPVPPDAGADTYGTIMGGNTDGIHECSGSYNHYEHDAGSETQLHIVGIYEPSDAASSPTGNVAVRVTRPGSSVLVLSAYEATHWTVTVESGATVERIILSGYHEQSASAPAGIPIEFHSYDQGGSYLGDIAVSWPSYRALDLVEAAKSLTGLELTSFRGCYRATSFQIDAPGQIQPPHPVSDKSEPTVPAGCQHLTSESEYCLSLSGSEVATIGLDSGEVCQTSVSANPLGFDTTSLGWQGDYVYGCTHERGLVRVSLVDGTVDIAPVRCEAATTYEGALLIMTSESVLRFDDFEAAARRVATETVSSTSPHASRMAAHGNRGYFAWHATDTVMTMELHDGAPLTDIYLEGYFGWIMGLDVTDSGKLVLAGDQFSSGLYLFDVMSGASQGVLAPDFAGNSLVCTSGSL